VRAGNSKSYSLPSWFDEDGDDIYIKANTVGSNSLAPFIKFQNQEFTFTPLLFDIGHYVIAIKLTDSGVPMRTSYYYFELKIIGEDEDKSPGGDSNTTENNIYDESLTAFIIDISMRGELWV